MANINPVPTLSTDGWVRSSAKRIDFLMVYFFVSDYLQTTLYRGKVSSFPWIMKEHPRDMSAAAEATRKQLNIYLSTYYDSVRIDVTVADTDPTVSATKTTMTIDATVTLNGETFSVAKLLSIVDGKLAEFSDLNNNAQ